MRLNVRLGFTWERLKVSRDIWGSSPYSVWGCLLYRGIQLSMVNQAAHLSDGFIVLEKEVKEISPCPGYSGTHLSFQHLGRLR